MVESAIGVMYWRPLCSKPVLHHDRRMLEDFKPKASDKRNNSGKNCLQVFRDENPTRGENVADRWQRPIFFASPTLSEEIRERDRWGTTLRAPSFLYERTRADLTQNVPDVYNRRN